MTNKNSYFCVGLSDDQRAALATVAAELADACAAVAGVGFDPMACDDLHMTACFVGDALVHLKRPALLALKEALGADATPPSGQPPPQLAPRGLSLFPPGKNNLIVMRFDAPGNVVKRQADAVRVCGDVLGKGVTACNDPEWLPHVTLGKLRGDEAKFASVLRQYTTLPAALQQPLPCRGCFELRGVVPSQTFDVAWDAIPL